MALGHTCGDEQRWEYSRMQQWVRGSASGTALVIAGLLVGASAVAAPAEPTEIEDSAHAAVLQSDAAELDLPGVDDFVEVSPTESATPTQEPTPDPPVDEDPTDEPTIPTEDPTEDPTDLPTEEPTEDPTEEPTDESTSNDGGLGDPFPVAPPDIGFSRAPIFAPIPTITAQSRADVSESDLWEGVQVHDDVDLRLSPVISDWGDWFGAAECPGGFPCTYRILYLVTDSHGNGAEAARDIIITGRPAADPVGGEDAEEQQDQEHVELPMTGIGSGGLLGIGAGLLVGGMGLITSSRRSQTR